MTKDGQVTHALLCGLVKGYHTIDEVAEFTGMGLERTQDALLELEEAKKIRVDDYGDKVVVELLVEVVPLDEQQRATVDKCLPMVKRIAFNPKLKNWHDNEDLAQDLYLALIAAVFNYKPEEGGKFSTYVYKCLRLGRTSFFQDAAHLRGYNVGDPNTPQIEDTNHGTETGAKIFDAYTAQNPARLEELRDTIDEVLGELDPKQAEALLLTEYYMYTGHEAAGVTGTSYNRVTKAKIKGLENLRAGAKLPHRRVTLPNLLLGLGTPWPGHRRAGDGLGPCPVCEDKKLPPNGYCLYCDAAGTDYPHKIKLSEGCRKTALKHKTKAAWQSWARKKKG